MRKTDLDSWRPVLLQGMGDDVAQALPPVVKAWRTWQFAQSLSKRTVHERTSTVVRMAAWCRVEPQHAETDHVVTWLAEGGQWSASTRHTYHCALNAWFLWLQKQGHRQDNPMVHVGKPRRPRCEPRPVSDRDLRRLLGIRMNQRTKTMIVLAAFAGLRVHEIAKVRGEHFDLVARKVTVNGKGGHTHTLPLCHFIVEQAYRMPREGWWFPGVEGGHQRRESVGSIIKDAMIRADVLGSAHCLRHWFGTALLERGVDLRTVQELMRHQQLTSTQIYTKVTDHRRAAGVDLLDPWARPTPINVTKQLGIA